MARHLSGGKTSAMAFPWAGVRYQQTSAARQYLAKTYAPKTTNFAISALRGVLKECWRLGLMDDDAYHHAIDIPRVAEENGVAGRSLDMDELRSLFNVCDADPSPAGIRDAALVAILYCTGIRRNEMVGLMLADYDLKQEAFMMGVAYLAASIKPLRCSRQFQGIQQCFGFIVNRSACSWSSFVRVRSNAQNRHQSPLLAYRSNNHLLVCSGNGMANQYCINRIRFH
jgi:hypothetical protein